MSDYPMLISNKLHSFRNFLLQTYEKDFAYCSDKATFPCLAILHITSLRQCVTQNLHQKVWLFFDSLLSTKFTCKHPCSKVA